MCVTIYVGGGSISRGRLGRSWPVGGWMAGESARARMCIDRQWRHVGAPRAHPADTCRGAPVYLRPTPTLFPRYILRWTVTFIVFHFSPSSLVTSINNIINVSYLLVIWPGDRYVMWNVDRGWRYDRYLGTLCYLLNVGRRVSLVGVFHNFPGLNQDIRCARQCGQWVT